MCSGLTVGLLGRPSEAELYEQLDNAFGRAAVNDVFPVQVNVLEGT